MSERKHTRLPWRMMPPDAGVETSDNFLQSLFVAGPKDELIARISTESHKYATPEQLANAEFIVRAVNSFDDLVAACKAAMTDIATHTYSHRTYTNLENALKKAKGDI